MWGVGRNLGQHVDAIAIPSAGVTPVEENLSRDFAPSLLVPELGRISDLRSPIEADSVDAATVRFHRCGRLEVRGGGARYFAIGKLAGGYAATVAFAAGGEALGNLSRLAEETVSIYRGNPPACSMRPSNAPYLAGPHLEQVHVLSNAAAPATTVEAQRGSEAR